MTGDWYRDLLDWQLYLLAGGTPATTLRLRLYHLRRVAREVGRTPSTLTFTELATWLSEQDWKPNTRKSARASLRSFYSWAMASVCTCGLLTHKKLGTRMVDGVELCNKCQQRIHFTPGQTPVSAVDSCIVSTLEDLPGYRLVRVLGVVTELSSHAGFSAESKGNTALDSAMAKLRRRAVGMNANAVLGLRASAFGAAGGITGALGGDAVGVLLVGDAVVVEPESVPVDPTI